jgi:hypothetical protein
MGFGRTKRQPEAAIEAVTRSGNQKRQKAGHAKNIWPEDLCGPDSGVQRVTSVLAGNFLCRAVDNFSDQRTSIESPGISPSMIFRANMMPSISAISLLEKLFSDVKVCSLGSLPKAL